MQGLRELIHLVLELRPIVRLQSLRNGQRGPRLVPKPAGRERATAGYRDEAGAAVRKLRGRGGQQAVQYEGGIGRVGRAI